MRKADTRKPDSTDQGAVICDWKNEDVDEDNITSFENMLYGDTLIEIMTKVASCSQDKGGAKDEKTTQS